MPMFFTPASKYLFAAPTGDEQMIPSILARSVYKLVKELTGESIAVPLARAMLATIRPSI
jgi:hypothetical protein